MTCKKTGSLSNLYFFNLPLLVVATRYWSLFWCDSVRLPRLTHDRLVLRVTCTSDNDRVELALATIGHHHHTVQQSLSANSRGRRTRNALVFSKGNRCTGVSCQPIDSDGIALLTSPEFTLPR